MLLLLLLLPLVEVLVLRRRGGGLEEVRQPAISTARKHRLIHRRHNRIPSIPPPSSFPPSLPPSPLF